MRRLLIRDAYTGATLPTHRIRDFSPAPPCAFAIRRRLFLFHALFLFVSSSKIFTLLETATSTSFRRRHGG